jgi:putative methionine-R-sulfoxide reductase with GAF domain
MSIQTDLASLAVLARVYRSPDRMTALQQAVQTLHKQVSYFDWVGLFLEREGDYVLEASSNQNEQLTWEYNAELVIPLPGAEDKELGKIVVRSKQPICFDVTDVSTLKKVAEELSKKLCVH